MTTPIIKDYIFYKIFCVDKSVDLSYIGSTADWKKRKSDHEYNCYNQNGEKYNYKVYKTIRENGGWGNFKMIEIGNKEQITLRQAEQIEEQYRVELNANMNGRSCFTTEEERKEHNKEQCKEWRENNKEHCKDYQKEWRENNKEQCKEQCKEWRKNNKEHIKEYNQTDKAKASNNARCKKYYAKKKLEKQQKDITITTF